jgi:hypothetical protein
MKGTEMDLRKDYVAPAIAAEDVLEQTSLACQVSEWPFGVNSFVPGFGPCTDNVAKGGAYFPNGCANPLEGQQPPVVLS